MGKLIEQIVLKIRSTNGANGNRSIGNAQHP
jgi:hypothetical protein